MSNLRFKNKLKTQNPNLKTLVLLFCICTSVFICHLIFGIYQLTYAEQLKECDWKAKDTQEIRDCINKQKDSYFKDNRYSEFVEYLGKLCPNNKEAESLKDYYKALARYDQLKYLEETKSWDEYFSKGNDYRDELTSSAENAIKNTTSADKTNIYSRLLLYSFHNDQQDAFVDDALSDLETATLEFAKSGKDISVIKDVADKLAGYSENYKSRQLYKVYSQKLVSSDVKDDVLKDTAASFLQENNLGLSENLYDIYIERVSKSLPKDKLIAELTSIAKEFSYKAKGPKDEAYAEKIFEKIDSLGAKNAFSEELIYLRAFNLEKSKEFVKAKDVYSELLNKFPNSKYQDEARFKIGVIFTYILRDIKKGTDYFTELAQKENVSPYVLSSLYQLGLLKQWGSDNPGAKEYFDKLISRAGDIDSDIVDQAQERLKEIKEEKNLEYNLKTLLDTALKEEFALLSVNNSDLKSDNYRPEKGKDANINTSAQPPASGCLQVEMQYLWAGDLGGLKPAVNQPNFKTSWKYPGTKVIGLVLISPSGISDRSIDMVDVF